ncbi:MAG: periplasmic heavy metal sensor [Sphingomonadales bacterium]
MSGETTTRPRTTLRWIGGLLAASLALNLFVGGYVIGRMLEGPESFRGGKPKFHHMVRDLSPDGKAVVKDVMKERRPAIRENIAEMHRLRDQLRDHLLAPEVDMAEFDDTLASLRANSLVIQDEIHAVMIDLARRLPPEERARLRFDRPDHGGRGKPSE